MILILWFSSSIVFGGWGAGKVVRIEVNNGQGGCVVGHGVIIALDILPSNGGSGNQGSFFLYEGMPNYDKLYALAMYALALHAQSTKAKTIIYGTGNMGHTTTNCLAEDVLFLTTIP